MIKKLIFFKAGSGAGSGSVFHETDRESGSLLELNGSATLVVYHATIVAIVYGLFKKFWPRFIGCVLPFGHRSKWTWVVEEIFGNRLSSTHCMCSINVHYIRFHQGKGRPPGSKNNQNNQRKRTNKVSSYFLVGERYDIYPCLQAITCTVYTR